MFRVFLFSSHQKLNWLLLLKMICSGSLFWLVELCESWIFYSALVLLHCTHGLHTHCKRSMCESGVKGPSHIQLMKSGYVQAIVQKFNECKNKNAVHVQTFMWDKYIYFFKCPKKCPLPPFKLKILSHKSYLRWEFIFKIKLRPWINVDKNLDWIITIKNSTWYKEGIKKIGIGDQIGRYCFLWSVILISLKNPDRSTSSICFFLSLLYNYLITTHTYLFHLKCAHVRPHT